MKKLFVFISVIVIVCMSVTACGKKSEAVLSDIQDVIDTHETDVYAETEDADGNTDFEVVDTDESETVTVEEPTVREEKFTYNVQALVSLNVRDKAGTDGKILGTLSAGDTLPCYKDSGNWYEVKYKDAHAYVSANESYSQKVDVDSLERIEKAISVGLSLLGTPYEYGATRVIDYNFNRIKNFTGKTFDCSSFVQYCFYTGAGVNLYGDSRTMSRQGVEIKSANMKRGDVIFMTSTARQNKTGIERIGHVAIYLGDNKILHTFGTGGVRVQEYSSFWKGRTIVVKRML